MNVIYLHESKSYLSINDNYLVLLSQVVNCDNFGKWLNVMKE